ncbi:mitochondrial fission process protein 1 [Diorhabda sublineata]|uniref:mitochondrial fission process protein 1 n=1 Tax=Diorhabda sublineata TaxID=1163346 RepID=UPI0024E13929|nr:mitochondrial fission process protein 1 [Diorhabda sublineata]
MDVNNEHVRAVDLYRETPIRYLGYANEVGEAFRSIIGSKWVNFSYGVATLYVLADTTDKSIAAYKTSKNEKNHIKKVTYTTADTLIWQLMASVVVPGLTINRVCAVSNFCLHKIHKLPIANRKWLVTGIGLVTIPFIIKPIDYYVDVVMDKSLRKYQPE